MHTCIIGIDCATDPQKRGVAIALWKNGFCSVSAVETGLSDRDIADKVVHLKKRSERLLLALDAPLGWPEALGKSLVGHQAGEHIHCQANYLFRRETDRFIREEFGKQPLDVGADRIARTAHSALCLLEEISKTLSTAVPLAWYGNFTGIAAIEVYPAATLIAHGLPSGGYKKSTDQSTREAIISGLPDYIHVAVSALVLENADALDAAICVLAATDFIHGISCRPNDPALARKEGWIWVKSKER